MGQPSSPAGDYLTIADAADKLGVKPWEVVRLIENDQLTSVTVVPAASLRTYQEACQ